VATLTPFERVVVSNNYYEKWWLTEVSDILEGLRDLTEGELSEVVHNGLLGELEVGSRGGHAVQY
jgi:hypothetical protein